MPNLNLKSGLLLCAKYAVAPNLFGYCGPDESQNIIDHLKEDQSDKKLAYLLKDFETLYPYLQLIARENNIEDFFDERVVEAYWVGNDLLNKVKKSSYRSFLDEKLSIGKKIDKEKYSVIKTKINASHFLPNHAFHVFNIFKRTSRDPSFQTVETMDQCRIGWGKIVQSSKFKVQSSKLKNILVEARDLIIDQNQLMLSKLVIRKIQIDYNGKRFIKGLKTGDWVSFHWGMVCDKLTTSQIKNLEYYTQRAINFYNG